jgi:hypothetical protein
MSIRRHPFCMNILNRTISVVSSLPRTETELFNSFLTLLRRGIYITRSKREYAAFYSCWANYYKTIVTLYNISLSS